MKQINFFDILTQKLYTVGYVLWHHETPLNQLRKYLTLKCLYTLYIYIFLSMNIQNICTYSNI